MCLWQTAVSTQILSLCDNAPASQSATSATSPDAALPSGLLSSYLARNGGRMAAGTRACPWSLRAAEYQRITLSIIEFPDPAAATGSSSDDVTNPSCIVVVERTGTGNRNRSRESMFCGGGGRRRESLVFTSSSHAVHIYVANMTSTREFLIKYEGIGNVI